MSSGTEVVFNTIVPPGLRPFLEQLHSAGFTEAGREVDLHIFRGEPAETFAAAQVEGLYGCLDYYQTVNDPFSENCSTSTTSSIRAVRCSPPAVRVRACTGG